MMNPIFMWLIIGSIKGNKKDCTSTLTARAQTEWDNTESISASNPNDFLLPQYEPTISQDSTFSYLNFFTNSDTSCPAANCLMRDTINCNSNLPSGIFNLNSDQSVTVHQSYQGHSSTLGSLYWSTFCLICQTTCCDKESVTAQVQMRIQTVISLKASVPSSTTLYYSSGPSTLQILASYTEFFDIIPDNGSGAYISNSNLGCQLFDPGCSYSPTFSEVTLDSAHPYGMHASNIATGFSISVCLKCTWQSVSPQGVISSQSAQHDNFDIYLNNPICANALSPIIWTDHMCLINSDNNVVLNPNGWSDFFTNSQSGNSNCPVTNCQLYSSSNCNQNAPLDSNMIKGSDFQFTYVNSPSPITLNIVLCVKCYIQGYEFTNNQNYLKLQPYYLQTKTPSLADLNVNFDALQTSAVQYAASYWSIFLTQAMYNCIVDCVMLDSDCSTTFSGSLSHVYMSTVHPYPIYYFQNIESGYSYDVCFKCSADFTSNSGSPYTSQSVTELWSITQTPDCTQYIQSTQFAQSIVTSNLHILNFEVNPDGILDFFSNSLPASCSISTCQVKVGSACGLTIESQYGSIDASYKFAVNYNKAYFDANPICIECTTNTNQVVTNHIGVFELKCPHYQMAAADGVCYRPVCAAREKLMVDATCVLCPDFFIIDQSQNDTHCFQATCSDATQVLQINGTCTDCEDCSSVLPNNPPFFLGEISVDSPILLDGQDINIAIPEIFDVNQNFQAIKFDSQTLGSLIFSNESGKFEQSGSSEMLEFDFTTSFLTISIPEQSRLDLNGSNQIDITLQDSLGAENTQQIEFVLESYVENTEASSDDMTTQDSNFTFEFKPEIEIEKDQNVEVISKDKKPIAIYESGFEQTGQLILDFSEAFQVLDQSVIEEMNKNISKFVDIQYFSQMKVEEEDEEAQQFSKDDIPLLVSYQIQEFYERYVTFDLQFTNKLFVSSMPDKDFVSVKFTNTEFFKAKEGGQRLREGFQIKRITVPTLFPSEADAQLVAKVGGSAQGGLMVSFLAPFIFMLFGKMSMDRVWSLYYFLQLTSNMEDLIKLLIPANALGVLQMIKNTVNFNIFKNKDVRRWVNQILFANPKVLWMKQMLVEQGNDTVYLILFCVGLVILYIGIKFENIRKICKEKIDSMIWCGQLRSRLSFYFPTAIFVLQSFLQVKNQGKNDQPPRRLLQETDALPSDQSQPELSTFDKISIFFKLSILIILPIWSYLFLKRNFDILSHEKFDKMYGTLCVNLNKNKPQIVSYTFIFCFRRFLIAFGTVFFHSVSMIMLLNSFSCLFIIKYILDSKPMASPFNNQIEVVNEVNMLVFSYFYILFTQFVDDIETRYELGYVFIGVVSFILIVNVSLISSKMYSDYQFDSQKNTAQKAWQEYQDLKAKMAEWIVIEASNQRKSIYGRQISLKQLQIRKEIILQKYSYQQMLPVIEKAMKLKKEQERLRLNREKNSILNALRKHTLELTSKAGISFPQSKNLTPRFGAQDMSEGTISDISHPSDYSLDYDMFQNEIQKITWNWYQGQNKQLSYEKHLKDIQGVKQHFLQSKSKAQKYLSQRKQLQGLDEFQTLQIFSGKEWVHKNQVDFKIIKKK